MGKSRAEYVKRMHKVLSHIDDHLDQHIDLGLLAKVANFSPFHFHRIFAAWMGQTLGDYVRRRRLELAAMRMASQPRLSVLDVATSVGFGSSEAFSRAFKARFGASPTSWKNQHCNKILENSNLDHTDRNLNQALSEPIAKNGHTLNTKSEKLMNIKIKNRNPAKVAYLRHHGSYGEPLLLFWTETVYPWLKENDLLESPRYGISHDDPSITSPEKCRYDACVEIPENYIASGNAQSTSIPGGKYAVMHFEEELANIGEAWAAILRDWLPSSGFQLDSRPCFEHYPVGSSYDPETGAINCEICVPISPL